MEKKITLAVKDLKKVIGKKEIIKGLTFDLREGEVFGFLGPNGAGKTTTIQILLGITLSSSGTIKYFGKDFLKNKPYCLQKINYTSSFNTLQGRISVWENLITFAYLYNLKDPKKKILDLVEYFEITDLLKEKYINLSAGQKTRVNFVKSLLNDPDLILMDEPTASLDPDIADKTLSLIEDLKNKRQISILYTSHDMDEVTRICDEVIFLDHGKKVLQDTPINLTKNISQTELIITFDTDKDKIRKYLENKKLNFNFLNEHILSVKLEEKLLPDVISNLNSLTQVTELDIKKPNLEDVFLSIARGGNNVHQ